MNPQFHQYGHIVGSILFYLAGAVCFSLISIWTTIEWLEIVMTCVHVLWTVVFMLITLFFYPPRR